MVIRSDLFKFLKYFHVEDFYTSTRKPSEQFTGIYVGKRRIPRTGPRSNASVTQSIDLATLLGDNLSQDNDEHQLKSVARV